MSARENPTEAIEEGEDAQAPVKGAAARRHGLGRGLSALLGDTMREESLSASDSENNSRGNKRSGSVQHIEISAISPHPDQPRRHFDETALQELADSVAQRGVIQPIIVRPASGGRYQIVAGERRWRAAQKARLHQIPAIVRDFSDAETLEIALIENVQRQDLNPVEEAEAYSRLIAQFGHSQEALGKLVGKSRSHVANMMRLLDLPTSVIDIVKSGQLSMGHARALIGIDNAGQIARQIVAKGLSVRQTEKLARQAKDRASGIASGSSTAKDKTAKDPDIAALEQHLADLLGIKVAIDHGSSGSGSLSLRYSTLDQLDMLCQRLSGEPI